MLADITTFRRRNVFERKALRLLRGEDSAASYMPAPERAVQPAAANMHLGEYRRAHFGRLRDAAHRNGLLFLALDAQFVTAGELLTLRWLAEAQRQTGLRSCSVPDIALTTALRHCAAILDRLGIFLPSKTLHIHTDLDDELSAPDAPARRAVAYRKGYSKDRFIKRGMSYGRLQRP